MVQRRGPVHDPAAERTLVAQKACWLHKRGASVYGLQAFSSSEKSFQDKHRRAARRPQDILDAAKCHSRWDISRRPAVRGKRAVMIEDDVASGARISFNTKEQLTVGFL